MDGWIDILVSCTTNICYETDDYQPHNLSTLDITLHIEPKSL